MVFTDPPPAYVDWRTFRYPGNGPGRMLASWLARWARVPNADVIAVRSVGCAPLIADRCDLGTESVDHRLALEYLAELEDPEAPDADDRPQLRLEHTPHSLPLQREHLRQELAREMYTTRRMALVPERRWRAVAPVVSRGALRDGARDLALPAMARRVRRADQLGAAIQRAVGGTAGACPSRLPRVVRGVGAGRRPRPGGLLGLWRAVPPAGMARIAPTHRRRRRRRRTCPQPRGSIAVVGRARPGSRRRLIVCACFQFDGAGPRVGRDPVGSRFRVRERARWPRRKALTSSRAVPRREHDVARDDCAAA
jgi:hypothetical protein